MDILRITDPIPKDVSIEEYEYVEIQPTTGTNLNNSGGEITITMQSLDSFTHPSNRYLLINGRLTKADGTAYADDDDVSLTNNGMMHLLKRIQYRISGQVIETILYPGQATTMLGLLKYPNDFSKSQGLNQLWYKDTSIEPN